MLAHILVGETAATLAPALTAIASAQGPSPLARDTAKEALKLLNVQLPEQSPTILDRTALIQSLRRWDCPESFIPRADMWGSSSIEGPLLWGGMKIAYAKLGKLAARIRMRNLLFVARNKIRTHGGVGVQRRSGVMKVAARMASSQRSKMFTEIRQFNQLVRKLGT